MYGYGRAVFGVSEKLGAGDLLYGGEAYHDDGPWTHPDNYYKFNRLLSYSQGSDDKGFCFTARGYHGQWHSSDQIAGNAVPLVGWTSRGVAELTLDKTMLQDVLVKKHDALAAPPASGVSERDLPS